MQRDEYIPSARQWVANQVALYESSGGTNGITLTTEAGNATGLPVVIVTTHGWRTGGIRKTPLMRVTDGDRYVLVASRGGAPHHPHWFYNIEADPMIQLQDETKVYCMLAREIHDNDERQRLWDISVKAYPPYADYQKKTDRLIPVLLAEPLENPSHNQ